MSLGIGTALALSGLQRGRLAGLGLVGIGAALVHRGVIGHCHGYHLLGIHTNTLPSATVIPAKQGCQVEQSVTIARSAAELYSFWRNVENLPTIMRHVQRVEALNDRQSRWTANGPLNFALSWEAEIFNERENEFIAWRSLPDSAVDTAGSIRFTPLSHDRGTAVAVNLRYNPPGGKVSEKLAALFGAGLKSQIEEDLRRFKSSMEAGEVPTVTGQPRGE
jgi:uncharacterized membrane protein